MHPHLRERAASRNALGLVALVAGSVAFAVAAAGLATRGFDEVRVAGRTVRLTASQRSGQQVFARSCAGCHVLAASDSRATIGPNLDYVQPTKRQTMSVLANGLQGANADMPAQLVPFEDAQNVADYLSAVADRRACCAP